MHYEHTGDKEMADEQAYVEEDFVLDETEGAGSGLPAPIGTHLCRITCGPYSQLARDGRMGWRIKGVVVERDYKGYIVEDSLWDSEKAKGRITIALHRCAGLPLGTSVRQATGLGPREEGGIQRALNGTLAYMVVERIEYNKKGSNENYTEAEAIELRAAGEKVYGHARIGFAGYVTATAEDVAQYSARVETLIEGSGDLWGVGDSESTSASNGAAPVQTPKTQEKLRF